jgi:hypothetical protein
VPPPPSSFLLETPAKVVADTESSNIWAGYVVTAQSGSPNAFSQAEGWYLAPSFSSDSTGPDGDACSSTSDVTWAGLGGYDSWAGSYLAQDGTAWNSNGVDDDQAWWEIVPFNSLTPIDYYAIPGETMDVSTRNISDGFRFWFYNYAGTSTAFDVTNVGPAYYGYSESAEVVTERPTVGKSPVDLGNFGYLNVEESAAAPNGGSEVTLDQYPANLNSSTGLWRHGVHMNDGNDLADPGDISSDGFFKDQWMNCR